ncbi:MAG: hypothetical protein JWQ79_3982 [Mucilaginibacter sp.]|nr:hypothetical protein [Mucilaginibacter sp.]
MKKILLLIALLFLTEANYARNKPADKYQNYLVALNSMSDLFSRLIDNIESIERQPDRESFKSLAVNFNRKVSVLIINNNHFISSLDKSGFSDKAFNNSYRIIEKSVADLKKMLLDNRALVDNLKIKNFNTADIYDHLNIQLFQNDQLIKEMPKSNRAKKAFKRKLADNLTQSVVLLNECHSKVAAFYSKLK